MFFFCSPTGKTKRPKSGKGVRSTSRTPPTPQSQPKEESIFKTMLMGPRPLVTVLIIKPGPVSKGKLVKILQLVMQEKFRVVGLRLLKLTEMQAVCLQPVLIRKVSFSIFV